MMGAPVPLADGAVLLDVRSPVEFCDAHVHGAVCVEVLALPLPDGLAVLDRAVAYRVYCLSGVRAARAVELMRQAGFADVTCLGTLAQAVRATGRQLVPRGRHLGC